MPEGRFVRSSGNDEFLISNEKLRISRPEGSKIEIEEVEENKEERAEMCRVVEL